MIESASCQVRGARLGEERDGLAVFFSRGFLEIESEEMAVGLIDDDGGGELALVVDQFTRGRRGVLHLARLLREVFHRPHLFSQGQVDMCFGLEPGELGAGVGDV